MPGDWQYHGNGVQTAVNTNHDVDGSLKSIIVELDCFKTREWSEDEIDDPNVRSPNHVGYDEQKDTFVEHKGGSHATIQFEALEDEENQTYRAKLKSITPEDGEKIEPRHMALLPAAERVVDQLGEIEMTWPTMETLSMHYDHAEDIHIERLDG